MSGAEKVEERWGWTEGELLEKVDLAVVRDVISLEILEACFGKLVLGSTPGSL